MEVSPGSPSKRSRSKVVAKEPAAAKPARNSPTGSRKKSTGAVAVDAAPATTADLHGMIETAAFYLAAERSFAPGHELDDWLEAERRIKARA